MRIAMIGPFGFHPKKTMRSRAFRLARELVQRGHQVKMLMPPWHTPQEANTDWQEEGVSVRYVALRGGAVGITWRLVREALAFEPHAVHCFKPKAYSGLVAWWLWQFHRRRLRLLIDSDDWEGWGGWNEREPYSPLQKRFFAWQERYGMRHCHTLTVASRTLQSLAWAHGAPPQRVVYLPNGPGIDGVDPGGSPPEAPPTRADLGLGERSVLLLYSRLFEFNNERLVAILAQVRDALPDLAILSVGAGLFEEDDAALGHQLRAAGLQEAIVDTGWLPEARLPAVLASADVGLYLMDDTLLNRTKCPVKLADMLALGLPVVGEAVGQVPEYVRQEQTGLLRQSGDVDGVARDVVRLLQDEALRQRLSQGARALIRQEFAWSRLAQRLEEGYG
ncbi:MAG TPA: glycosyltransferase family 4 protein [Candidatus Sulfomarinibacteraceae bacterium]|nr:glycosyltransferase family 4 protein [Candidatus Sulfomarinibacteraceae bacterium]